MKKIDRYILRSLLSPFLGSVFALTMILLVNSIFQLMDLLVRKGIPFITVLKVILLTLPSIMNMTIPMSFLVAGLIVFGRMAGHNEILCIRSSGIYFKNIFLKLSAVMAIIVVLNMTFNLYILPESNFRLKQILFEIRTKKPAIEIEPGIFNKMENYLIYASSKDEKTGELRDIKIQEVKKDGVRFISASRGKIYSVKKGEIVMELYDGEFIEARGEKKEEFRRAVFSEDRLLLNLDEESYYKNMIFRADKDKPIGMLIEEIKDLEREYKFLSERDEISRTFTKKRENTLLSEINSRFALPVASIIFILFSFPIAVKFKFSGYGSALGVSFFFFIPYYVMLLAGKELSRRTLFNPYIAIWAPNLIFAFIAIFMLRKELAK